MILMAIYYKHNILNYLRCIHRRMDKEGIKTQIKTGLRAELQT